MARFRWIYHLRNFEAAIPLLFALIFDYYESESEYLVWGVGPAIFLIGLAIRIWAQ